MDYPIKIFEIVGTKQERIKLEILEVFGFPNDTSFRGGYDARCHLEITLGAYACQTARYYTATASIYDFYVALQDCYNKLSGKATYSVYCPENDLVLEVIFNHSGCVEIKGKYRDDLAVNNVLSFEFCTDQSYFKEILSDLKKIYLTFGDKKGIKE